MNVDRCDNKGVATRGSAENLVPLPQEPWKKQGLLPFLTTSKGPPALCLTEEPKLGSLGHAQSWLVRMVLQLSSLGDS